MSDWNYAPKPRPKPAPARPEPQWVPDNEGSLHWFDGHSYTGQTQRSAQDDADHSIRTIIRIFSGLLVIVGLFLNFRSVNLLQGSDLTWVGTVMVAAAFVLTLTPKPLGFTTTVLVGLLAAAAIANAVYVESQLAQKRDELRNVLNIGTPAIR